MSPPWGASEKRWEKSDMPNLVKVHDLSKGVFLAFVAALFLSELLDTTITETAEKPDGAELGASALSTEEASLPGFVIF